MTQPPDPAPQDRIAEIVLKVIAAGGLTAGGAGAFWQVLKDDGSIRKAIVSGVVGLGMAYGAKLLMPIHRGNEECLEKAGTYFNQAIDRTTDRWVEDWYLQCQALDCQSYRPESMPQYGSISEDRDEIAIQAPELEEVFVSLALGCVIK